MAHPRTTCAECGRDVAYKRNGARRLDDGRKQPRGRLYRHAGADGGDCPGAIRSQDVGDPIDPPRFR
jgi:hypothetical protein